MTVAELMTLLATMPADAVVRFPDTYEQSEGWGEGHDTATLVVCGGGVTEDGSVVLYGDEDGDWDEDEDEEEE